MHHHRTVDNILESSRELWSTQWWCMINDGNDYIDGDDDDDDNEYVDDGNDDDDDSSKVMLLSVYYAYSLFKHIHTHTLSPPPFWLIIADIQPLY